MKQNLNKKEKKVKAWIEISRKKDFNFPTIWGNKPSLKEIQRANEYGFDIIPCIITYHL